MDLATHQRRLLELLRGHGDVGPDDDTYLHRVAESRDLREARGNIFLWRVWVLERSCVLTYRLLRKLGLLEEAVFAFIGQTNISPFRETQGPAFLALMSGHPDTLVAAVASTELAIVKVKQGDPAMYTILWKVEPHRVLNGLAKDNDFDAAALPRGNYQVVVSSALPFTLEIVTLSHEL